MRGAPNSTLHIYGSDHPVTLLTRFLETGLLKWWLLTGSNCRSPLKVTYHTTSWLGPPNLDMFPPGLHLLQTWVSPLGLGPVLAASLSLTASLHKKGAERRRWTRLTHRVIRCGKCWGIFNWIVNCSISENPPLSRPLTCVAWLWKGSLDLGGVFLGTTYRGSRSERLYLIYCIFNGPGSNWAENYPPKCCIPPKAEVIIIKPWCQVEYHHSLNQSFINNGWLPQSRSSPTTMKHLFEFPKKYLVPCVRGVKLSTQGTWHFFIRWQKKVLCLSHLGKSILMWSLRS